MIEDDSDSVVIIFEKLISNVIVEEFDDILQIRDETDKNFEKFVQKVIDD